MEEQEVIEICDHITMLSERITKLETALRDIIKHQEIIGGGLAKLSSTYNIARKALEE